MLKARRRHRSPWPVVVDTAPAAAACVMLMLFAFFCFGATPGVRGPSDVDLRYGMIGIMDVEGPDRIPRQGPLLVFNKERVLYNGLELEDAEELADQLRARWDLSDPDLDARSSEKEREREHRQRLAHNLDPAERGRYPLGDPRFEIMLAAHGGLPTASLVPHLRALREARYQTVHFVFHGDHDYAGARTQLVEQNPPSRRALGVKVAAHRTFAELARAVIVLRRRGEEVRLDF